MERQLKREADGRLDMISFQRTGGRKGENESLTVEFEMVIEFQDRCFWEISPVTWVWAGHFATRSLDSKTNANQQLDFTNSILGHKGLNARLRGVISYKKTENKWIYHYDDSRLVALFDPDSQEKIASDNARYIAKMEAQTAEFVAIRKRAEQNTAINGLRMIEGAKDQWALENKKGTGDKVTEEQLLPYFARHHFPEHPEGGKFIINPIGTPAESTVYGKAPE